MDLLLVTEYVGIDMKRVSSTKWRYLMVCLPLFISTSVVYADDQETDTDQTSSYEEEMAGATEEINTNDPTAGRYRCLRAGSSLIGMKMK